MAPTYKLIYFDAKGRAECCRFLFKYGNIDFEDVRISPEDWPTQKEKLPFGQVPLLEVDGVQINQSLAISRYLAHIVKLAGNNDWEDAQIDAIVDTLSDIRTKIRPVVFEQDPEQKKKILQQLMSETLPYYLKRLEAIAQKNKGHLALGRLTWADFQFTCVQNFLETIQCANILDAYPSLKEVIKNVESIPAIKNWISIRPKTAI